MAEKRKFSIGQCIAEAVRETDMRKSVYPRRVSNGSMRQAEADYGIELMQDIADKLTWMRDNQDIIVKAVADRKAERELAARAVQGGAS